MKRLLTVCISLATSLVLIMPSAADTVGYVGAIAWTPSDKIGSTAPQVRFYDYLSLHPWDSSNSYVSQTNPAQWLAQMPLCAEVQDMAPCITSLMGKLNTSSAWQSFVPGISLSKRPFTNGIDNSGSIYGSFKADKSLNRPIGALARIWTSPSDISTLGGRSYLLVSTLNSSNLNLSLTPVKIDTDIFTMPVSEPYGQTNCPWSYKEVDCIQIFNFPANAKFRVDLHLGDWLTRLVPWYHGRLSNPNLSVTGFGIGAHLVVEGYPMQSLVAHAPMTVERILSTFPGLNRSTFDNPPIYKPVLALNGGDSIKSYQLILKDISPVAMGQIDSWRLTSIYPSQASESNACLSNKNLGIGGIVVTNATSYDPDPPAWNPLSESLDFSVAAPHFSFPNIVFAGEYRVIIKTSIANCLWGADANQARAVITILDENGTSQITATATTIADGNVYISIMGFHYSGARISVKLEKLVTPTPTPTATPTPTPTETPTSTASSTPSPTSTTIAEPIVKKSTIICIKGKSIKRVTAVRPKCPKAYRKK